MRKILKMTYSKEDLIEISKKLYKTRYFYNILYYSYLIINFLLIVVLTLLYNLNKNLEYYLTNYPLFYFSVLINAFLTIFYFIYRLISITKIEKYDEKLIKEFNDFLLKGKEETEKVKKKCSAWYRWVKPFINFHEWGIIIIILVVIIYIIILFIDFTSFLIIIVALLLLLFAIIESKQNQFKQLLKRIFY